MYILILKGTKLLCFLDYQRLRSVLHEVLGYKFFGPPDARPLPLRLGSRKGLCSIIDDGIYLVEVENISLSFIGTEFSHNKDFIHVRVRASIFYKIRAHVSFIEQT